MYNVDREILGSQSPSIDGRQPRFRIAAGAIRVCQLGLAHFGRIPEMRRDRWEDGDGWRGGYGAIRDIGWMGWWMRDKLRDDQRWVGFFYHPALCWGGRWRGMYQRLSEKSTGSSCWLHSFALRIYCNLFQWSPISPDDSILDQVTLICPYNTV